MNDNKTMRFSVLFRLGLAAGLLALVGCGSISQPGGTTTTGSEGAVSGSIGTSTGSGGGTPEGSVFQASPGDPSTGETASQPMPPERPSATSFLEPDHYPEDAQEIQEAWYRKHCHVVRLELNGRVKETELCKDEEYWWLVDEGIGEAGVANRDGEESNFPADFSGATIKRKVENPFRPEPKIEAPAPIVNIPGGSPPPGGNYPSLR